MPNMHRRTKFHKNWSNGCSDIVFNNFQNGGRPPSWIFKSLISWTAGKLWRTNMCHHTQFCKNRKKGFWRYRNFSIFKMAAVRHLGFSFFLKFLVSRHVGRPNVHRRTKFHRNRSNGCWDIAIYPCFQDGGRPPFWNCDANFWDDSQREFGGVYHCAKSGWNRISRFDDTKVEYFALLAWKRLFTPLLAVLGIKIGENRNFLHCCPSRNAIARNWRHIAQTVLVSGRQQILGPQKRIGKLNVCWD